MLETVDLSVKLPEDEYRAALDRLRPRLLRLQRACWNAGVGSLVVFEGWAFSGRTQAIRTLTQRLEPRGFVVHHVLAPRSHEAGLPWMWRFWDSLPRYGQMAVYLGGWYRRVFVARSQGALSPGETDRAFSDINSFERLLVDDRYALVKFFFHLDLHEESRRIAEVEEDPLESWKLASDDWEARTLDPRRLRIAEQMLARTSEGAVPWNVIAATDSSWARIQVLEKVSETLAGALAQRGLEVPD